LGLENPAFKDDHELEKIKTGKLDFGDKLNFTVKGEEKSDLEEISDQSSRKKKRMFSMFDIKMILIGSTALMFSKIAGLYILF